MQVIDCVRCGTRNGAIDMAALSCIPEVFAGHLGPVAGLVVFAITGAFWSGVFGKSGYSRTDAPN